MIPDRPCLLLLPPRNKSKIANMARVPEHLYSVKGRTSSWQVDSIRGVSDMQGSDI